MPHVVFGYDLLTGHEPLPTMAGVIGNLVEELAGRDVDPLGNREGRDLHACAKLYADYGERLGSHPASENMSLIPLAASLTLASPPLESSCGLRGGVQPKSRFSSDSASCLAAA